MSELALTNFDELVLTVRDCNSRTFIGEAISAYLDWVRKGQKISINGAKDIS